MFEPLQNGDLLIEGDKPSILVHIGERIRLECVEGSSNKFYELWTRGATVYKHYGRIGSPGKTDTDTFPNSEKARKHYDAMLKAKVKKGYKEKGVEKIYFFNAPWRKPVAYSLAHSDLERGIKSQKMRVQRRK